MYVLMDIFWSVWGMGSGPCKCRIEGSLPGIHEVMEIVIKEDENYYLYWFGVYKKARSLINSL